MNLLRCASGICFWNARASKPAVGSADGETATRGLVWTPVFRFPLGRHMFLSTVGPGPWAWLAVGIGVDEFFSSRVPSAVNSSPHKAATNLWRSNP